MSATCSAFQSRELEIPADLSRLGDAREWAAQTADDFGLTADDRFRVRLAMSEAVTNAIIHGSAKTGDVVRVTARVEADLLVFEVADQGRVARAGRTTQRLAEGGRGLELVSMVMDEVELVRVGERGLLRFAKRREAAA